MDFDDLELQILKNPARSLQLITIINNSEKKLISTFLNSLAKFLVTHLGDACHAEAYDDGTKDGRGVRLYRKDLLVIRTGTDEETQEIIYSYNDSNFWFSVSLHPDVTAWSLLEKGKLNGNSDIVISFNTNSPDDLGSCSSLDEVAKEIDKILLPTAYKKRKSYGSVKYVLQKKIYISSETLLEDLVKGRMESYFDPILSALSGFHRIPWGDLKIISEKIEVEMNN
jgi:hypothetical protein